MPRRSHKQAVEAVEDIRYRSTLQLPPHMSRFLDVEAKRLSKQTNKNVSPQDIVRALIAAYYEKRMLKLVTCPDD